jgi:hypothetical protein
VILELPGFTKAASGTAQSSLDALRAATTTSYFQDGNTLWVKLVVDDPTPQGPVVVQVGNLRAQASIDVSRQGIALDGRGREFCRQQTLRPQEARRMKREGTALNRLSILARVTIRCSIALVGVAFATSARRNAAVICFTGLPTPM